MRKKERYEKVIAWFQDNIPVAETELHYNNPYELLIAVILSAQCTDKRVNIITPPLYKDFPTPEALAATTPEVIFEYIRSVSYPNNKAPVKREPISLDRFILMKGLPAGLSLLLLSIPYGMTTNYVAMYARQIGLNTQTGFFFTFMAVGMAISRIFSGKLVDRGKITQVIAAGLYLVVFSFFLLSTCVYLIQWNDTACTLLFFGIALLMGVGFGIMFPAFNTLFVNLAPNSQRGTATSTYLTSWDVGIGIGMLTGGYIAEISTFDKAYLFGACLTVVSALYFRLKVTPHYHKNKLR